MKDFTFKVYKNMLKEFLQSGYKFITVQEYFTKEIKLSEKYILMRHDVDRRPLNSLAMAKLENSLGVKSSYYFRTIDATFKPDVIVEIASLNHEIAYHYESLAEMKGDYEKAIIDFKKNLNRLRKLYPVRNIAMHGRPTSKWDSRELWKRYDYKSFGLLSEPYFDIDFSQILYLTDASRSWDNSSFNLRDRVDSNFNFNFKSTKDIIDALKANKFPNIVMFNIHPEHWSQNSLEWYKIYTIRKVKNSIKSLVVLYSSNKERSIFA